jgi:hypothetical protein
MNGRRDPLKGMDRFLTSRRADHSIADRQDMNESDLRCRLQMPDIQAIRILSIQNDVHTNAICLYFRCVRNLPEFSLTTIQWRSNRSPVRHNE